MDLSPRIGEYIKGRASDKLEKFDKDADKDAEKTLAAADKSDEDVAALRQQQTEKRVALQREYQPAIWLDSAAARAKQIVLATHAAKFSHSDSRASSLAATHQNTRDECLGSHSLGDLTLDVVGNAAALDVANLLLLEEAGTALWQQIRAGDGASLRTFSTTDAQLEGWLKGLAMALDSTALQSHALAKQAYFPVGDNEYHLISPLHATSLSHAVYQRVQHARYSEAAKKARRQRKAQKGCGEQVLFFPGMAGMSYGGSKPQNISLLNSRRGGKSYLLNCAPPTWSSKQQLPLRGAQAFWRIYRRRVWKDVEELKRYLGSVSDYNNLAIREGRARRVSGLVDQLLQLAAELRELGEAGWSVASQLPLFEQCFLDPERRALEQDKSSAFAVKIDDKSWREELAERFARWLNGQLGGIKNSHGVKMRDLGDAEALLWQQEVKGILSRMRGDLEHWL